jgi:hypothetical protein
MCKNNSGRNIFIPEKYVSKNNNIHNPEIMFGLIQEIIVTIRKNISGKIPEWIFTIQNIVIP